MLKISLDEAYVFDLLSIYEVKIEKCLDLNKKGILIKSYENLLSEICDQIGKELFEKVIKSSVYNDLKESNSKVFDLVERANENPLAKNTAEANYERYIHKKTLQNKFFYKDLNEIKLT